MMMILMTMATGNENSEQSVLGSTRAREAEKGSRWAENKEEQ